MLNKFAGVYYYIIKYKRASLASAARLKGAWSYSI